MNQETIDMTTKKRRDTRPTSSQRLRNTVAKRAVYDLGIVVQTYVKHRLTPARCARQSCPHSACFAIVLYFQRGDGKMGPQRTNVCRKHGEEYAKRCGVEIIKRPPMATELSGEVSQ